MSYKVITHWGKAHLDEILGISLLSLHLGELPANIERIDPQQAREPDFIDNKDDNTWFLDCGMRFDPDNKLFDHHQDSLLDSTAKLIFSTYFPHLKGSDIEEFIDLVSLVDTQGIFSLEDFSYMKESKTYFSFTQKILFRHFESYPLDIVQIYTRGLKEKIEFLEKKKRASIWLNDPGNIEILFVSTVPVLAYKKRPPLELVQALRSADKEIVDEQSIEAIYSFDENQEDVRVLFRTNHGASSLNFTKSKPSKVHFIHKGGFLMKFIPSDSSEWLDVVKDSLITNISVI